MVLVTNRLTPWVFVRDFAALLVFYFLGALYIDRPLFLEMLNGMLGVVSLVVTVVYSADIWARVRTSALNGVTVIRIGIAMSWTVAWVQAFSRVYFIEFRPSVGGRTFDALVGAPAVVLIIGAALHLIAIGMIQNQFVRRNMCLVVWSLLGGIGGVLALRLVHQGL